MIFTIGVFAAFFFAILLFNKKNKSLPDKILAYWMLVIGIHLASTYTNLQGYWEVYPHLIGVTAPLPLFYGPLLYLYVVYSIKDEKRIKAQDYAHFVPVALGYLYMFRFYFFYSAEEKRMVDKGLIDDFGTFSVILLVCFIASAIGYAVYSYRLLSKYKTLLDDNFSNTEHINLNWLESFIWGVAIVFGTATLVLLTRDVLGVVYPFNPDLIFYSMIILGILSLGYFGIKHENIFTDNVVIDINPSMKASYRNSSLKEDLATDKHKALTDLMAAEKPYLQTDLTLNSLAEKLDVSPHHLSQIINQFEEQNFNDFVNKYRVEEFIDRASKDSHFSFLALALDSGFNSKSTFNAVFRKHKGTTPSQFMSSQVGKAS